MSTKKNITKAKGKSKASETKKPNPFITGFKWFKVNITSTDDLTDEERIKRQSNRRFLFGLILLICSFAILLSMVSHLFTGAADQKVETGADATNWLGLVGYKVAKYLMDTHFGVSTILFPVFMTACSLRIMKIVKIRLHKWFLNCMIIMVWCSTALALATNYISYMENSYINWGGSIGHQQINYLHDKIGFLGSAIVLIATAILYMAYVSDEAITAIRLCLTPKQKEESASDEPLEPSIDDTIDNIEETPSDEQTALELFESDFPNTDAEPFSDDASDTSTTIDFTHTPQTGKQTTLRPGEQELPLEFEQPEQEMTVMQGQDPEEANLGEEHTLEPYDPKLDLEFYKYPTIDLLKKYDVSGNGVDMEEQQANKNQIIDVLRTFGVEISSIKATVGPTITLYEITPAPGVRISRIKSLENDIALSLRALGIRIIAPIPGKGTIGIEVPNAKPQMVSMESIINTRKFQETDYELPMALGKTITNEVFMVDLAKMPHLLVAGATGQGKSVGLNAILTSLLYKKHPAELKIVMVDPKKVEFSVYMPLVNHFLAQVEGNEEEEEPIITDVKKVIQTLNSLCIEMDTRYDLLKKARARNLKEYNQKFRDRHLLPTDGHRFLPYIVVVIDEFGDLIMTAGKEVELPIARIAQLARAVGIHMIIATQRPTTNIITGTIKANFPARMAFKVSSMIDSRTILDRPGANQLVGRGDMLFLAGSEPVRVQCAFVDTPEVEAISNYISQQQGYLHPFPLPEVPMDEGDSSASDVDMSRLDSLFEECAKVIVLEQVGSASMIQRKFSIGYNRAGRIIEQMEKAGIVGPARGAKQREVLVQSLEQLQAILDTF